MFSKSVSSLEFLTENFSHMQIGNPNLRRAEKNALVPPRCKVMLPVKNRRGPPTIEVVAAWILIRRLISDTEEDSHSTRFPRQATKQSIDEFYCKASSLWFSCDDPKQTSRTFPILVGRNGSG